MIISTQSHHDYSLVASATKMPTHIQKKVESAIWFLKNDDNFMLFLDSHSFSFDNITIAVLNSDKEIEMLRKVTNEAVTVTFDSYVSEILQISFEKEFLKRSAHKTFEAISDLKDIMRDFSDIVEEQMNRDFSNEDNLFLIDRSHTQMVIKEKVADKIGRWMKHQTKANVAIFIFDEFGDMKSFYETSHISYYDKFFKSAPFKTIFHDNSYYIPIANSSQLFGVCIISQSGSIDENKLAMFKLGTSIIATMLKDF